MSEQHIGMSAKLGMDTVGFLMMAHMISPEKLLEQARLMESYGANCIYCTDSAGYMLPDDVTHKIGALRAALKPRPRSVSTATTTWPWASPTPSPRSRPVPRASTPPPRALARAPATRRWKCSWRCCERMGIDTGVDLFKIMDVAEDLVVPMMDHPIRIDRDALTLGYAGVYSSFLLFAKRAEQKYGVSAREILVELGRRGMVGGQEDMIEDLALTLSRAVGCCRPDCASNKKTTDDSVVFYGRCNVVSRQQVAHQRRIAVDGRARTAEVRRGRSVGFILEQLAQAGGRAGTDDDEQSTSGFAHGESRHGFIVVETGYGGGWRVASSEWTS